MAKAILVMEMPESCFGCNFCHISNSDGEKIVAKHWKYQGRFHVHMKSQIGVHSGYSRRGKIQIIT